MTTIINKRPIYDCAEWVRVLRMKYDSAIENDNLEKAEVIEDIFHDFWSGYASECSSRWCDILKIPYEDGGKVLHQEFPYECLYKWIGEL